MSVEIVRPYVQMRHGLRYHPMSHVRLGDRLVCGFDDYDGLDRDGGRGPGWAVRPCGDCLFKLARLDDEANRVGDCWEELEIHQTEEMMR